MRTKWKRLAPMVVGWFWPAELARSADLDWLQRHVGRFALRWTGLAVCCWLGASQAHGFAAIEIPFAIAAWMASVTALGFWCLRAKARASHHDDRTGPR
jgi:hypothetical protein